MQVYWLCNCSIVIR